jgi:hypothetical protein
VADDSKSSVGSLVSIFSSLKRMKDEPTGVSGSIIKDSTRDDKVDPSLDSNEISRFTKIANIYAKALQDAAPKPTAERLKDLTPEKQKSLGMGAISDKTKSIVQPITDKKDLIGDIFKFLTNAAIAGLAWMMLPKEAKDKIKEIAGNLISGLMDGLKVAFKEYLPAFIKSMKELLFGTSPTMGKGGVESPGTTGILSTLWNNSGVAGNTRAAQALTKPIFKGIELGKKGISYGKSLFTGSNAVGAVVKDGVKMVGPGTKIVAEESGVMAKAFSKALKYLKVTGKGVYSTSKWLSGLKFLAPLLEVGSGVVYKREQDELLAKNSRGEPGGINLDEYQRRMGKKVIDSIGGLSGSLLGPAIIQGVLTGVSGGLLTPLQVALSPLITFGGALAGDWAGRKLAGFLTDYVLTDKYTRYIGASFTGTTPTGELQDYIMQNGVITSFSNKDQVLGMKTGGAIDNLLQDSGSSSHIKKLVVNTTEHNKFTKSAIIEQIKRQDTMIDLLIQLVKKPTGGTTMNTNTPSNVQPSNFRQDYNLQTLIS